MASRAHRTALRQGISSCCPLGVPRVRSWGCQAVVMIRNGRRAKNGIAIIRSAGGCVKSPVRSRHAADVPWMWCRRSQATFYSCVRIYDQVHIPMLDLQGHNPGILRMLRQPLYHQKSDAFESAHNPQNPSVAHLRATQIFRVNKPKTLFLSKDFITTACAPYFLLSPLVRLNLNTEFLGRRPAHDYRVPGKLQDIASMHFHGVRQ